MGIGYFLTGVNAFVPMTRSFLDSNTIAPSPFKNQGAMNIEYIKPVTLQRQRKSMTSVATMSLFGLGAPELAIILIAGAFLLGPQKLAELGKDAGKIAGELKDVPKEFQKGFDEGQIDAKSRVAKPADPVDKIEEA